MSETSTFRQRRHTTAVQAQTKPLVLHEHLYEQDKANRLGLPALRRLAGDTEHPLRLRRHWPFVDEPAYREMLARVVCVRPGQLTYMVERKHGDWQRMSSLVTEDGRLLYSSEEELGYFITQESYPG